MRFFVGRPDSLLANPPGLMPAITQSAQSLVDMFNAKTIGPDGLAALVGAHTTANQFFAIPASCMPLIILFFLARQLTKILAGSALDPTPGVWDATFYNFTANAGSTAPFVLPFLLQRNMTNVICSGVTKFPSDVALSQSPLTKPSWTSFMVSLQLTNYSSTTKRIATDTIK
jgi:hypothetical protein